jgi:hypothetical protein
VCRRDKLVIASNCSACGGIKAEPFIGSAAAL